MNQILPKYISSFSSSLFILSKSFRNLHTAASMLHRTPISVLDFCASMFSILFYYSLTAYHLQLHDVLSYFCFIKKESMPHQSSETSLVFRLWSDSRKWWAIDHLPYKKVSVSVCGWQQQEGMHIFSTD